MDPELPFKIWPRIQAKKKERHHKETTTTRNPNVFFRRKKRFRKKKGRKLRFLFALGLLAFLWQTASKHNNAKRHHKPRGFVGLFLLCCLWSVYPKQDETATATTTIKTKVKQNKENTKTDDNTKPSNKNIILKPFVVIWRYFYLVLVVVQKTKTKQQNHNTTKQPNNKTTTPPKRNKQQQEGQPNYLFTFFSFFLMIGL